jgi:hypothetical protein
VRRGPEQAGAGRQTGQSAPRLRGAGAGALQPAVRDRARRRRSTRL